MYARHATSIWLDVAGTPLSLIGPAIADGPAILQIKWIMGVTGIAGSAPNWDMPERLLCPHCQIGHPLGMASSVTFCSMFQSHRQRMANVGPALAPVVHSWLLGPARTEGESHQFARTLVLI